MIVGNSVADITGGFGVDSYYFSKKTAAVTHFEIDKSLSDIAVHNFQQLKARNITCKATDGLQEVLLSQFDTVYADPSRRHNTKGKVFYLKDCAPNIPEYLSSLLKVCNLLLIKTSPMLDISAGLEELTNVYQIHIVAVNNEVKELLWLAKKTYSGSVEIVTKNFKKKVAETYSFTYNEPVEAFFDKPKRFLYEPNAAILKGGAFNAISQDFKVKKLHEHTHLYTSEALREFPGRRFIIEKVLSYSKNEMKKLGINKANITTRNFQESVSSLRKKFKIKDGGDVYLFFSTIKPSKKVVLVCSKVKDEN